MFPKERSTEFHFISLSVTSMSGGRGGGGVTWVNVCWVCAAGLSEP